MIEIHTDTAGNHRFSLKSESGNTLLTSIAFSDKTEMKNVIRKLGATSVTRNNFERKTNTEGKFLFSLNGDDGRTVGHSEPYDSEAGMENGIINLRGQFKALI